MDIGITRVVRHFFALKSRPSRRTDDLAWLRLDVSETNFFILAVQGQMRVVTTCDLAQGLPGLHSDMAIGLRRELQHHLAGVDVGFNLWHALCHARGANLAIEFTQLMHFIVRVPTNALATVAKLLQQRPQSGEALVGVGVVAFDDADLWRCHARDQIAIAFAPLLHIQRLRQFGRRVVHERGEHQLFFHAQMTDTHFTERFGKPFVDLPIALALPRGIYRGRQGVDEGVHVAGVEVVLLVPRGGGQHDV